MLQYAVVNYSWYNWWSYLFIISRKRSYIYMGLSYDVWHNNYGFVIETLLKFMIGLFCKPTFTWTWNCLSLFLKVANVMGLPLRKITKIASTPLLFYTTMLITLENFMKFSLKNYVLVNYMNNKANRVFLISSNFSDICINVYWISCNQYIIGSCNLAMYPCASRNHIKYCHGQQGKNQIKWKTQV
jgi:hypothetical protein